jgi:hypothetical protein
MKAALIALLVGCGRPKPAALPTATAPSGEHASPIAISNSAAKGVPSTGGVRITGIDPAKGDAEGGTYAKLEGNRLLPTAQKDVKVYFGSRPGEVVRIASDSELIVRAPAGTPDEVVDVRLTFEGGEVTLPHAFTFVKQ